MYYSWEIALNVGLDVSINRTYEWEVIWEKALEVNRTKVYMRLPVELSTAVCLV
jgi:hypothetical protein